MEHAGPRVVAVLLGIAKWKREQALPDGVTVEAGILAEMAFWLV